MIGVADGLDLRNDGRDCRSPGRSVSAALIAACTSRAAPSMLRLRSNCTVMRVEPSEMREVISVTPGISPSRRSSGAATVCRHGLGIGARPAGADADGRELDRRHAGDRQEAVGDRARPAAARWRAAWCRPAGGWRVRRCSWRSLRRPLRGFRARPAGRAPAAPSRGAGSPAAAARRSRSICR